MDLKTVVRFASEPVDGAVYLREGIACHVSILTPNPMPCHVNLMTIREDRLHTGLRRPDMVAVYAHSDQSGESALALHHVFQVFQRKNLDYFTGRFRLEHGLFTGERVDTFASFCGRLLVDSNLHQTRHAESAGSTWLEVVLDETVQCFEH